MQQVIGDKEVVLWLSGSTTETDVDDATYANGGTASDFEATTVALTLAF